MKKTLISVLIAIFLMIPLASFAKTAMSDSELGTISGETGISIDFSSFILGSTSIGTNYWGVRTTSSPINDLAPKKLTFWGRTPFFLNKIILSSHGGSIQAPANTGLNSSHLGVSYIGGSSMVIYAH
ncbi:MAG: hypothetical protein CVU62_09275 [Deltaproteobacteria bacterium HGW-Deltaproteobacteria-2]|nr:MAG: hypothetical protein CVU62_09275 [Deltaproteobacteria bacterium HGW-Deltaproteobacteria-2]